jgi:hypothetical protein
VGNWLTEPFTLFGVTFENWMLIALAVVVVLVVFTWLARP